MIHSWVYGTTEPQDFQLEDDGENLVGTGLTVTMEFREAGVTGTVEWLAIATGTVRVTAVTGMEVGKTYHFRFKLTDTNLKVGYCPNSQAPDEWLVARV